MHSRFQLPLILDKHTIIIMKKNSLRGKHLIEANLIIIDEASSMKKDAFNCISKLLQNLMNNNLSFGGKVVLLGGDFRQTLPVMVNGQAAHIIGNCLRSCVIFNL